MRKLPKQARSRQLVASLVQATREVILLKGIDGVTTCLVARAAGVSQGSLYQYFENRDQLVEAVLEEVENEVSLLMEACIADSMRIRDRSDWIRAAIDRILDFHSQDDGLRLELAKAWAVLPERFRSEAIHRKVAEVIRTVRARDWPNAQQADLDEGALVFVNNAVVTLATMQRNGGSGYAQAAIRDALVHMLEGTLQMPPSKRSPENKT